MQSFRPDTSVQALYEKGRMSRYLHAALLHSGFDDLADLSGYGERRLRLLKGLGPSTSAELRVLLREAGISL
jgi:hypothetical protein